MTDSWMVVPIRRTKVLHYPCSELAGGVRLRRMALALRGGVDVKLIGLLNRYVDYAGVCRGVP